MAEIQLNKTVPRRNLPTPCDA